MLLPLLLPFVINAPASVEVRGWMIHGAKPEYQALVLRKAKEYGINHLEISGDNPTFSEEMVGPAGDLVAKTAEQCRAAGINAYIWVRELNTRERNLSVDPGTEAGAKFWATRRAALSTVFDRAPALNGIIMSLGSTPTEIWSVKDTSAFWTGMTMEQRIQFVTKQFISVAAERGKTVYIRDFNHSPQQLKWLINGLKDQEGFTMHSKWEPQDWQPFYPDSNAIGAYGKTPQVIEADLGAEYWGRSMIPVSMVPLIKRRWDYDRSHGCKGIVARIDRDDETCLDTPSEINLFALSRYLAEPSTTPAQVYDAWNDRRYGLTPGSAASKTLTGIYERGFIQARKMYFTLDFWTPKDQTMIPSAVRSIEGGIVGKSTALWDPKAKPTEMRLRHPDAKVYGQIIQDRLEAIRIADRNLQDFGRIRPALKPADAADWQARLELAKQFAVVWHSMADAVWSLRVAEEKKDTSPETVARIKSKAESFAQLAQTLIGAGPGSALRTNMAQSAKKLSADIIRRAEGKPASPDTL